MLPESDWFQQIIAAAFYSPWPPISIGRACARNLNVTLKRASRPRARDELLMLPQFLLFCIIGITTTAVDFAVFNLLTRPAAGWRRIPANTVSVSTAMAWSFLANWFIVFHPEGYEWLERAWRFLLTTAFSAFVLQNVILWFTTYVWTGPAELALFVARKLPRNARLTDDVISRNACKALAVSAGLVWNFYWYKYFVYAL